MSLIPARMKKIQPICKMKALECLQAYNYIDFSDAREQLTPKSVVEFRQNLNIWLNFVHSFYMEQKTNY